MSRCQALKHTFSPHWLPVVQGSCHLPFLKTSWRTDDRTGARICENHHICCVAQSSGASLCHISPRLSVLNCKGKGSFSLIYNHRPQIRYRVCNWGREGSPFIRLFNEQRLRDCLSHAVNMVQPPFSLACPSLAGWNEEGSLPAFLRGSRWSSCLGSFLNQFTPPLVSFPNYPNATRVC